MTEREKNRIYERFTEKVGKLYKDVEKTRKSLKSGPLSPTIIIEMAVE